METFSSYLMSRMNLRGSGGNKHPAVCSRLSLVSQSPCPRACSSPAALPLADLASLLSLPELLEHVPCSHVPSYSTATSCFIASTVTRFPEELWTSLPLSAFLNFKRETSEDHHASSTCCMSLFYSQPLRFVLHACDWPAFVSHGG